jgi:hypothetical protein
MLSKAATYERLAKFQTCVTGVLSDLEVGFIELAQSGIGDKMDEMHDEVTEGIIKAVKLARIVRHDLTEVLVHLKKHLEA